MNAGTIGLLESPDDEPLKNYHDGGWTTLEVRETQEYLDDSAIQSGRVAATVESEQEEIHVAGGTVEVETIATQEHVWTPWVADVDGAGFVVAERTRSGDPPFPFDVFHARTGHPVAPARIDVAAFIQRQNDADREWDCWMTGRKHEQRELSVDDTAIAYGEHAMRKDAIQAEIGVGFKTPWRGTVVRGVLYESGYAAVYDPQSWGPIQFARFVQQELLSVASVPSPDESEQAVLGEEEVA